MKRCPAIHMPVANATSIAALAHCISHSRELVTMVDQFEIFAVGAARGVTGHHDSRRRADHQGQSGEHDANQFQSALVCHRKASFRRRPRKARLAFPWPVGLLLIGPTSSVNASDCHLFPIARMAKDAMCRSGWLLRTTEAHPEMVLRASVLPPSLLSALAQIVPAERCFSCGNCAPENRLFVCWIHRPIEAGQLEVDGTGFYGSTLDESFF